MVLLPYKHMAKILEREKAQEMRKSGVSISDIAKKFGVSKSTVSLWCRDIVLTETAIQKIVKDSKNKSTLGILRYTESLRIERQKNVDLDSKKGMNRLNKLSSRDILCIGLGLYWGEGYKKGSQEFGFTNSDPDMVRFYIKWLKVVFNVSSEDLILRISINELHKNRIKEVQKFWTQVTNISISQFTLPSYIKTQSKKVYENSNNHFGTLRIKVRRGTRMRREVLGMIKACSE